MRLDLRSFPDGCGGTVSGVVAFPDAFAPGRTPAIVLAHGAGNDMSNPLLSAVHEGLADRGYVTIKFNFPYKERGGRAPDPAPVLERCYRSVLGAVRASELKPGVLVIGGKSLGGRIASHLAAQGEAVAGLLLLGYPLHPPGKLDRLRTSHLGRITVPMLFLAGTRDSLCDLALLRRTIAELSAPVTLHVIEDGDHSFQVLKRTRRDQADVVAELVDVSAAWVRDLEK